MDNQTTISRRAVSTALLAFVLIFVTMSLGQQLLNPGSGVTMAAGSEETLLIERASGGDPLTFTVEVARTPQEKALGLMYRRDLPALRGMLFPYPGDQEVTMWMKNTLIPLDMVFIKSNGVIHRIEAMTEPFSERIIASKGAVSAVLEIAGGEARRLGLSRGDTVRHSHFNKTNP